MPYRIAGMLDKMPAPVEGQEKRGRGPVQS